jgi:putative pyruvate formate lyase activating enzyme
MTLPVPSYVNALSAGTLETRVSQSLAALKRCTLCPRRCRVDRSLDEKGYCRTGRRARVASYNAHFGEEAPLVGQNGSGTIFFSHCNLLCNFCQNYDISHGGEGREIVEEQLAGMMLELQNAGCHNINFVTPSHVVPQILAAVAIAARGGLCVPLVYNSSGYDNVGTLKLLEGIVDIYMPDFKFWGADVARITCDAPDYPEVARRAVKEMHRQTGDFLIDKDTGLAVKGLLVRHLVLPGGLAGTADVMAFLAGSISPATYVNLMAQYRPCGQAGEVDQLAAPLSASDYEQAVREAKAAGITRLDRPRRVFRIW